MGIRDEMAERYEASDRSGAANDRSGGLSLDPGLVFVPSETLCPACEVVTGSKGERAMKLPGVSRPRKCRGSAGLSAIKDSHN